MKILSIKSCMKINIDFVHFVHAACYEEAKKLWDRRKERVNSIYQ